MSPRLASAALWLSACCLACTGDAGEEGRSVYTSIARDSCSPPPEGVARTYSDRGLGVEECEGRGGYRLYLVSSDANSWVDLGRDGHILSLEEDVVYRNPVGLFPNVGGSERVEWRLDRAGAVRALVFRVTAQDPELRELREPRGAATRSRLFVVRLSPAGGCLLGSVASNDQARALADAPGGCPATLP
jgi:hypothetical protein